MQGWKGLRVDVKKIGARCVCFVFHKKRVPIWLHRCFSKPSPQELTILGRGSRRSQIPYQKQNWSNDSWGLYIMFNLNKGVSTFKRIFKNLWDATETKENDKIKNLCEPVCIEKILLASKRQGHQCEGQLRPAPSSAWLTEYSLRMAWLYVCVAQHRNPYPCVATAYLRESDFITLFNFNFNHHMWLIAAIFGFVYIHHLWSPTFRKMCPTHTWIPVHQDLDQMMCRTVALLRFKSLSLWWFVMEATESNALVNTKGLFSVRYYMNIISG